MVDVSKAERRYAQEQALANTRIAGHVPSPEFLADFDAVVEGNMTCEQAIKASLARATGRVVANDNPPAQSMTHYPVEPAFLDDEGPSAEIPPFITTTNARELYDLQPGETVSEAIARHQAEQARRRIEKDQAGGETAAHVSLPSEGT